MSRTVAHQSFFLFTRKPVVQTALYVVVWLVHTFAGFVLAMMLHLQNLNFDIESSFSNLAVQQILRWNIYALFIPLLLRLVRWYHATLHDTKSRSQALAQAAIFHTLLCGLYCVATFVCTRLVVNTVLGNMPWLWGVQEWSLLWAAFVKYYFIPPQGMAVSVLHYVIVIVCLYGVDYYRSSQRDRLRAMDLERQLTAAQLDTLKMQLHPHFLFNTLNSAVSLVHDNPDAAETMLVRLSAFLRRTLDSSSLQTVSLQEELEFVRLYTGIELVRFGDRLRIIESVEPGALGAEVPSLLLQPIVENAIRHGVADRRSGGTISIKAHCETNGGMSAASVHENNSSERIILHVQDDGGGLSSEAENSLGIGLANTRARLEKLYGEHQSLTIENMPEGGVCVTIIFPFRPFFAGNQQRSTRQTRKPL